MSPAVGGVADSCPFPLERVPSDMTSLHQGPKALCDGIGSLGNFQCNFDALSQHLLSAVLQGKKDRDIIRTFRRLAMVLEVQALLMD